MAALAGRGAVFDESCILAVEFLEEFVPRNLIQLSVLLAVFGEVQPQDSHLVLPPVTRTRVGTAPRSSPSA